MIVIVKISLVALLAVFASFAVFMLDKKGFFKSFSFWRKQIFIGIIFGIISSMGTEFGVPFDGFILNARDTAPICAGLLFGGPSGIIAGFIGGLERWFAVYWGAGAYTRTACTVSTMLAGIIAALFRKYLFDDKKPTCLPALAIGVLAETLHILMVFMTNMDDVARAFSVVKICAFPLIATNSISVFLAVSLISILTRKQEKQELSKLKPISYSFQKWLFACVIIIFATTTIFSWRLQTFLSHGETKKIISVNINDVQQDISDASDSNMLKLAHEVASQLDAAPIIDNNLVKDLYKKYNVAEIDIIGVDGKIIESTNSRFIGFDMGSGKQSAEFNILLKGHKELVQEYQPISYDQTIYRKYAGVALKRGGYMQIGYSAEQFQHDIDEQIIGITKNRHVGEHGSLIIADKYGLIVSDRKNFQGKPLDATGFKIDWHSIREKTLFRQNVYGSPSYCMYVLSEGYYIIGVLPVEEAMRTSEVAIYLTVLLSIIMFGIQFVALYVLIKYIVVKKIQKVNDSLAQITGGNLNVVVNVRSNSEFASLSDDINMTVATLKHYIAEAAARIDKELEFARIIQKSALPSVFPPFPDHKELDIFASMNAAKEVGGDFYDFYMVNNDTLAFIIADVSGKGIPAAMFMMTSKTLINSLATEGLDIEDVIATANDKLCENNEANMFITAFMGFLDLKTGKLRYVSAGHNPPLVRHGKGNFEYLPKSKTIVLAAMDGYPYKAEEMQLEPGDVLYAYTDGVTEATDSHEELYGEPRLKSALDAGIEKWNTMEELCHGIKQDVDAFVGDAPQFDDITMVALRWQPKEPD
ncbi:MAG: SpoIIE family protein phosphatase [Spirochaetia bacterium]|nr:SpoIIE family protein phosphatase [Spirochaetia bacterium]